MVGISGKEYADLLRDKLIPAATAIFNKSYPKVKRMIFLQNNASSHTSANEVSMLQ
jgi:hypothetical protein